MNPSTQNHPSAAPAHDRRHANALPQDAEPLSRAVRQFARFLHRPPDAASVEDLRNYQLYLVDHGNSPVSLNAAKPNGADMGPAWM